MQYTTQRITIHNIWHNGTYYTQNIATIYIKWTHNADKIMSSSVGLINKATNVHISAANLTILLKLLRITNSIQHTNCHKYLNKPTAVMSRGRYCSFSLFYIAHNTQSAIFQKADCCKYRINSVITEADSPRHMLPSDRQQTLLTVSLSLSTTAVSDTGLSRSYVS